MNENRLNAVISYVRAKTGIEISICRFERSLRSDFDEKEGRKVLSEMGNEELLIDRDNDKTYFTFKYGKEKFLARLDGSTKSTKNYAFFIKTLIESFYLADDGLTEEEKLRRILSGELNEEKALIYIAENKIADCCYVVAAVKNKLSKGKDIVEYLLKNKLSLNDKVLLGAHDVVIYVKCLDEKRADWQGEKLANTLIREVLKGVGVQISVGVGNVSPTFSKINVSYEQALGALSLGSVSSYNKPVTTFADYMPVWLLKQVDSDVLKNYYDEVLSEDAKALFEDDAMVETAEAFFDNDLNISEASREMYMHRNTLMYRLDKIESVCNLNIKKFSDASMFRMLAIIRKLI